MYVQLHLSSTLQMIHNIFNIGLMKPYMSSKYMYRSHISNLLLMLLQYPVFVIMSLHVSYLSIIIYHKDSFLLKMFLLQCKFPDNITVFILRVLLQNS